MSFYQNGILISGVNTLPELTRAQYEALPADKRPEYWVCLDEEYEPSSSGHTIQDNSGTDMPQEDNLQFVGAYTEDDTTNGKTKVNIVRPMTKEQYEALTPAQKKGFIHTTDEPDNPIMDKLIITEDISTTFNITAGGQVELTFPNNTPSGYKYLGVINWAIYVGTSGVGSIFRQSLSSNEQSIIIGIASTVARTNGTFSGTVLYIKQ